MQFGKPVEPNGCDEITALLCYRLLCRQRPGVHWFGSRRIEPQPAILMRSPGLPPSQQTGVAVPFTRLDGAQPLARRLA